MESQTINTIGRKSVPVKSRDFFVEVFCKQRNYNGEHICGDVFRVKRIKTENRMIIVLSDGMGHGVKANIMATLTSSFALNFTEEHKDFEKIADIIMNTLPVNAETSTSYSTFTIVDIDFAGSVKVMEYDNPHALILRGFEELDIPWSKLVMDTERNKGKVLKMTTFIPRNGDRIIFGSDGIVQSGLGILNNNVGWPVEKVKEYVLQLMMNNPYISASELAQKVVNQAHSNDGYVSKDDMSCVSIYFRNPRECMICTGPPYDKSRDVEYVQTLKNFKGKKIICGGTTAEIIAKYLNLNVETDRNAVGDPDLPPLQIMPGVGIVTEGILTLTKVYNLLGQDSDNSPAADAGPAGRIVSIIRESDMVHFLVGTSLNSAHQDPELPVELEIRRTIVKRIAKLLDEVLMKDVKITYY